jgi:GNAT superfamily N-acetyltransferase
LAPVLKLRAATHSDIPVLRGITERAESARRGARLAAHHVPGEESWRRLLTIEDGWGRVAELDDVPVGFVLGFPSHDEQNDRRPDDTQHLKYLMVEPALWGRGVGGRLLDWASEHLRGRGVRTVELWTEEDNTRSRQLYEKKGYRFTGSRKAHEELGEVIVQYRLDIWEMVHGPPVRRRHSTGRRRPKQQAESP